MYTKCVFNSHTSGEVLKEVTPEREGGGDLEDMPTTLEAVLSQLGIPASDLMEVFQKEQIDFDSLVGEVTQ